MVKKTLIGILMLMVSFGSCNIQDISQVIPSSSTPPITSLTAQSTSQSPSRLPLATFLHGGYATQSKDDWTVFTNANSVLDLLVKDNEIWAATTGGVVRWDMVTGSYIIYTTLDGLASNVAGRIIKDSLGSIWTSHGTDGVSRFDGREWRTYLNNTDVITIGAGSAGDIWASYYWGVSHFNGSAWQNFTDQSLSAVDVIFTDSRGNVWFSNRNNGVTRYDGKNWKTFSSADGLAKGGVTAIYEDNQANLWFGGPGSVSRFDGAKWQSFTISDKIPKLYIQNITGDNQGNIWVAAYQGGIFKYDGKTWQNFTIKDGLPSDDAKSVTVDDQGGIWVIAGGNLGRFDGTKWQTIINEGLATGTVRLATKDDKGNLYFGTLGSGISRYDGTKWQNYLTQAGLSDNKVTAIAQDSWGNMWFGMQNGSVSRFDSESWLSFTAKDLQQKEGVITLMLGDSHGNMWARGQTGVSVYNGTSWRLINGEGSLVDNKVASIIEDNSGNIWLGTGNAGVVRFDGRNLKTFTIIDGLGGNGIGDIALDSLGNIWLATGDSSSRYNGTKWEIFPVSDGIYRLLPGIHGDIWIVTNKSAVFHFDGKTMQNVPASLPTNPWLGGALLDSRGSLWLASFNDHTGALYRYDGKNWKTFTTADGLSGFQVQGLTMDSMGNVWAVTNGGDGGVSYFDGNTWKILTTKDGLSSNMVNRITEDKEGNLWFGGQGGVSRRENQ